jgi:hypothetical protein
MVPSMSEPDQPNLETLLSALHDSEINGAVSWFYDGVWRMTLGDPHNGTDAEAVVGSIGEAVGWLRSTAVRLYPDSTFARKYRARP